MSDLFDKVANKSSSATALLVNVAGDEKTTAVWHYANVSRQHDAVLWFEGERICARNADGDRRDSALAEVDISSRLGNIPRQITFPDGVLLTIADNDFIDNSLRRRKKLSAVLYKLEEKWRWLFATSAFAAVLIFAFLNLGVPVLADMGARQVPQKLLASITDDVYKQFASLDIIKDSQLDWETSQKMKKIFAEVVVDTGVSGDYDMRLKLNRLSFSGKDTDDVNAFALPDGLIVAADGLVKVLSEEEFAAVMAHEIGHVSQRHGMRSFIQSIGLFAFISFIFGDPSFMLAGSVALLNLKYSRDFEREADCFTYHRYLRRKNLPEKLLEDALLKIEQGNAPIAAKEIVKESGDTDDGTTDDIESAEQSNWGKLAEVLSTHPASEARVNLQEVCGDDSF